MATDATSGASAITGVGGAGATASGAETGTVAGTTAAGATAATGVGGGTSTSATSLGTDGGTTAAGGALGATGTPTTTGAGGASTTATTTGGGGSGGSFDVPFMLGADISSVQENSYTFVDTDGQTKSIFELLKNHGFNAIRIKAFVDPSAPYGYASTANGCMGMPEAYGDKAHIIDFGKQIKAAGMGFLLDFHYSDTWADPGNQIIPDPWRNPGSISELASDMKAYTVDVLSAAVAAGARPDMVQVGNEITPGILMHVPGSDTDCWGNNPSSAPIGGSTSNWDNLAALLKAGIEGVREVDSNIKVMLHIENTDDVDGVRWWVDNATSHGVEFDVLGLSCYTAFQGQPSVWRNTFDAIASEHPELKFVIAEYNPNRTEANTIIHDLPNGQGLGTFFWEPTRSGEWGNSMFTQQGQTLTANSSDFAEYDSLRSTLGL